MKRINWHGIGAFVLCLIIWGLVLSYVFCSGCTGMSAESLELFEMSNDAAQVANEQCIEDANTCAEGLGSVAEEFQTWVDIFSGIDPNRMGVE